MDDAIWFKFMTDTTDLTQVFNPEIIDVGEFEEDFAFPSWDFIEWWDVENKSLIGGEVTLPDAEYMDVGVQKTEQGYLIYIMWQDT